MEELPCKVTTFHIIRNLPVVTSANLSQSALPGRTAAAAMGADIYAKKVFHLSFSLFLYAANPLCLNAECQTADLVV